MHRSFWGGALYENMVAEPLSQSGYPRLRFHRQALPDKRPHHRADIRRFVIELRETGVAKAEPAPQQPQAPVMTAVDTPETPG